METEIRRRSFEADSLELRSSGDGLEFVGHAAVFNQVAQIGGSWGFREQIAPGAFKRTVKNGADVKLKIDHEGVPLARTKSGTLELKEDDIGLFARAPGLDPENPRVQELASAMDRGDIDQMSIAFRVVKEEWDESEQPPLRTVKEAALRDVSVVADPAYEGTDAALRHRMELLASYAADLGVELPPGLPEAKRDSDVDAFAQALATITTSPDEGEHDPEDIRRTIARLEALLERLAPPEEHDQHSGAALDRGLAERLVQLNRNRLRRGAA